MSGIDLSLYVRAPNTDVPNAVALGVSLISAMPKEAPVTVKAAGKKLRTSVLALQAAWGTSAVPMPLVNKRAADSATDNGWGCLESRLSGYGRLPAAHYPKAARALEIHTLLFPRGLDFLTLPYKAQWAEGEKRLQLVVEQGLTSDIDALAGAEFLAEVKRTHKVYGEVLGVTKAEEPAPEVRLLEPLRAVANAVVDYSLQLLAHASADPNAEANVRKALKPIDDHRAAAARRAASGGASSDEAEPDAAPEVTPKTPVPEIPA